MGIFHRYNSTIHGNYRKAYLRSGLITGLLLSAYVLIRLLMGKPLESPTSYVSDAVMLVAVFLFMAFYRNSLPDKKITLKEAMLFGIGTAVVAAFIYGLALWAFGIAFQLRDDLDDEAPNPASAVDCVMQSRSIPRDEARRIVVECYLDYRSRAYATLEPLANPALKILLYRLIGKVLNDV